MSLIMVTECYKGITLWMDEVRRSGNPASNEPSALFMEKDQSLQDLLKHPLLTATIGPDALRILWYSLPRLESIGNRNPSLTPRQCSYCL